MTNPETLQNRPIGVFDSGVGGLTVVRALMERLPLEHLIYYGDTARVPYGVKSRTTIETYSAQIVAYLLAQRVRRRAGRLANQPKPPHRRHRHQHHREQQRLRPCHPRA